MRRGHERTGMMLKYYMVSKWQTTNGTWHIQICDESRRVVSHAYRDSEFNAITAYDAAIIWCEAQERKLEARAAQTEANEDAEYGAEWFLGAQVRTEIAAQRMTDQNDIESVPTREEVSFYAKCLPDSGECMVIRLSNGNLGQQLEALTTELKDAEMVFEYGNVKQSEQAEMSMRAIERHISDVRRDIAQHGTEAWECERCHDWFYESYEDGLCDNCRDEVEAEYDEDEGYL